MKRGTLAVFAAAVAVIAGAFAFAFAAGDLGPASSPNPSPQHGFTAADYPIFSTHFVGSPSPFHETVHHLVAAGARLQPTLVAANLWKQGVQTTNVGLYRLPIFVSTPDQPTLRFSCVTYGTCAASGKAVHVPPWAAPSEDSDHHLAIFDTAVGGELDGWGGDGRPEHVCKPDSAIIACAWGGFFPFRGNGLDDDSGDSANNGGYAFGLFVVTAAEILQGHIDHAMGMFASCLDNPDIYPADTIKHTDTSCSGTSGAGNPQYGQLIRLKDSYDIAHSAYSGECKTILTAFARYGAYTYDTNNGYGFGFATDDPTLYADPNPWFTRILPDMMKAGDAQRLGSRVKFHSCLNHLGPDDIEVYDLAPGT